jgi:hypothetical protein
MMRKIALLPLFNFKMANAGVQSCEYNGSMVEMRWSNHANAGVDSYGLSHCLCHI